MAGVNIYLEDCTYDGNITMELTGTPAFRALRVKRGDLKKYADFLDGRGIIMLLVGTDSLYVDQSGSETIYRRLENTHSGDIDSKWHTAAIFRCSHEISLNELGFLENAVCEAINRRTNFVNITPTPAKSDCNAQYRKEHYELDDEGLRRCEDYEREIITYLRCFPYMVFPRTNLSAPAKNNWMWSDKLTDIFFYSRHDKSCYGWAEIPVLCGKKTKRHAILRKGSKLSANMSKSISDKIGVQRRTLEHQGKIVDGILMEDLTFDSPGAAGMFLTGRSFDGNVEWKTDERIPLKELL